MTVVEFHSVAGEIQCIFTSKWTFSKDFLIPYKTLWLRAVKKQHFSIFGPNFQVLKSTFSSWNLFSYKNIEWWSPCGLVVMTLAYQMERQGFESAAWWMLLSQKGFEYVTMNPLLPAKAVDCQPAVSCSEMRCKDLGQATRIQTSFILTDSERRLT